MKELWKHHFKNYDLFQNNFSRYRKIIDYHVNKLKNQKVILDAGSGTGNLTLELLKQGSNVTAVDLNEYGLEILREKCKGYENLEVRNMNVEDLDFDSESFDGVSSMFVVPFVDDNIKHINEAYRVLKYNGIFTISAWTPEEDILDFVMGSLEKELTHKKILPKFQKEWDFIVQSSLANKKTVIENGLTPEQLANRLKGIGFKDITLFRNNPYGKYACSYSCRK